MIFALLILDSLEVEQGACYFVHVYSVVQIGHCFCCTVDDEEKALLDAQMSSMLQWRKRRFASPMRKDEKLGPHLLVH